MTRLMPMTSFARQRNSGFTLIEIMVALALGLLLSIGIISLFGNTSRTNRLQNGLARLQENGRFAVTSMESDLRMTAAQYCSNFGGSAAPGTVVPVLPLRAPVVLASALRLPDPGPGAGDASLTAMNSVDATGYPSAATTTAGYILSPRYFVQGYSCATGSCTPNGLPSDLPALGTNVDQRLRGSDVLTIRYQRGTGWSFLSSNAASAASCATGATLRLNTQTGDDALNFSGGQLALVTDCINSSIVPVGSVAGNVLTLGNLTTGSGMCLNSGSHDMRVFNFSSDFVTVTYYVRLKADPSPDARPNSSTSAARVIPVLMRRENGVDQELVQGVDQLTFRYGVQDATGRTRFFSAAEIEAGAGGLQCAQPPDGVTNEPGCMWRSVRLVEAHLLVNTVDEIMNLDTISRKYNFLGIEYATTDATLLPSGLKAGSMLRREFIAYVSNRNYNF
jgi:type IV pilus assembly protein PilW